MQVFHESISLPVEVKLSLSNQKYAMKLHLSCCQEDGKQDCNTIRITAVKKCNCFLKYRLEDLLHCCQKMKEPAKRNKKWNGLEIGT